MTGGGGGIVVVVMGTRGSHDHCSWCCCNHGKQALEPGRHAQTHKHTGEHLDASLVDMKTCGMLELGRWHTQLGARAKLSIQKIEDVIRGSEPNKRLVEISCTAYLDLVWNFCVIKGKKVMA